MALKASQLKVGDTHVERVVENLTRTQIVMYCGASGDYNPLHADEVYVTQKAGYPSVFAHGMLTMGLTGKMLTNYVGDGRLTKFGVRFTNQVWPGDDLDAKATVAAIREEGGQHYVDLTLRPPTRTARRSPAAARPRGSIPEPRRVRHTQRRLGSLPSRCWPTVSKCERRPCTCCVTVFTSRKRRSNGLASKIAVAPCLVIGDIHDLLRLMDRIGGSLADAHALFGRSASPAMLHRFLRIAQHVDEPGCGPNSASHRRSRWPTGSPRCRATRSGSGPVSCRTLGR